MKLNHFICPNCEHDFYMSTAYGICDACQTHFYARDSLTCKLPKSVPAVHIPSVWIGDPVPSSTVTITSNITALPGETGWLS